MQNTTARDELASIRALMEESQGLLTGTWPHQAMWGSVGFVGLLATWWGLRSGSDTLVVWVWAVVLVVGWTFSLGWTRRGAPAGRVRNVATRAFGGIWLGLGVTLTLLATTSVAAGAVHPSSLPGLIAIVFGAGYFASGFLSGLRWLSGVGVAWWTGGVALLFWRGPTALLVLALMTVAFEIVPALVLRSREQSGTAVAP